MVSAFVDTPEFALNVAPSRADIPAMTRNPAQESAESGRSVRFIRRGSRRAAARAEAQRELESLREKVSVLAMQKDYWWQRSVEHASALRVAEAEVASLREAAPDLVLVTK